MWNFFSSDRDFWRRHKRKIFVSAGVLGSGYLLYKLYDTHKRRLDDLERELALQRENDELIKAQLRKIYISHLFSSLFLLFVLVVNFFFPEIIVIWVLTFGFCD